MSLASRTPNEGWHATIESKERTEAGKMLSLPQHLCVPGPRLAAAGNRSWPMVGGGWIRIVAIGSRGLQAPLPQMTLSQIGRAAPAGCLKTLSSEVAGQKVTVNMVLPGRVATPRTEGVDSAPATREATDVEQVRATPTLVGRYGRPRSLRPGCLPLQHSGLLRHGRTGAL